GHTDPVRLVALSPVGRRALSVSADKTIRLWDAITGKELRRLPDGLAADDVRAVGFAPDGGSALFVGAKGTVQLWDVEAGKELRGFAAPTGDVSCLGSSPDGRLALTGSSRSPKNEAGEGGSDDSSVRLWDVATGKELRKFEANEQSVTCVAFSG